ncbi:hypothetical protein PSTEL_22780 [Paenibacillus stellifer]|uniref:Crp/Fnr family transcriptional regulator n=1 Tax=Paenibacillus stellifer TaxID=169760 RepID=A0A089LZF9_9BACL|nr:Crp/Fnr family transcriptional regulator [Paenibacillus stellifer]AIQ65520.1 hypothetical protein PSTEL_22780 [Paenibacillus stellifer]
MKPDIGELQELMLFQTVREDTLEQLREISKVLLMNKTELLFSEKAKLAHAYVVLSGNMTVFRYTEFGQKRVIYLLSKGDLINEIVDDHDIASINCEAFEKSRVLAVQREGLLQLMQSDFALTSCLMNAMARKIRRLYWQIKNTIPLKMEKKVAAKLWKLCKDHGVETEGGIRIDLDITAGYLADMLGSSRETVSRALTELENLELILRQNRRIIVVDRSRLAGYFKSL